MAAATTITGTIELPDGSDPINSFVRFVLTGYETDEDTGTTILAPPIDAPIDVNGNISLTLFPNDAGTRGTLYKLSTHTRQVDTSDLIVPMRYIRVPEAGGPYILSDLQDSYSGAVGEDYGMVTEPVTLTADFGAL